MARPDGVEGHQARVDSLSVGGEVGEAKVTLCIYAEDLDPQQVSNLLGCNPTHAARRGEVDPRYPKRPPAPTGRWLLESPHELAFGEKVAFLLDRTSAEEEQWHELAANHRVVLSIGLFLSSWNEGVEFPVPILKRLAARSWTVSLDIYSADSDEVIEALLRTDGEGGDPGGGGE